MDLGPMNVGHGSTREITCPSRTSGVRGLSRHSGYFQDVPKGDLQVPNVLHGRSLIGWAGINRADDAGRGKGKLTPALLDPGRTKRSCASPRPERYKLRLTPRSHSSGKAQAEPVLICVRRGKTALLQLKANRIVDLPGNFVSR